MKILLTAINAKYIHSNLAVYSLKANCGIYGNQVKLMEYSINQYPEEIFRSLYREHADILCFSCYIWNLDFVEELIRELGKLRPGIKVCGCITGGCDDRGHLKSRMMEGLSHTGI